MLKGLTNGDVNDGAFILPAIAIFLVVSVLVPMTAALLGVHAQHAETRTNRPGPKMVYTTPEVTRYNAQRGYYVVESDVTITAPRHRL